MSVAVQRSHSIQTHGLPPFARNSRPPQRQTPPKPKAQSQSSHTPGLIRLPPMTLSVPHARASRPRQRKQQDKPKAEDVVVPETPRSIRDVQGNSTPAKKPSNRRSPSHTPKQTARTKSSQAEVDFDLFDSDLSLPSYNPPSPTTTPAKPRPATAPSTPRLDTEPVVRPPRTRRSKAAPTQAPASEAIPIPVRAGSMRAKSTRSAASVDVPLSRSVPLSISAGGALPDWDSPPTLRSRTEEDHIVEPESPTVSRGPIDHSHGLIPWETFEDDAEPSVTPLKSQSTPALLFPAFEPPSPTRRSARPVHRHIRTASVPTLLGSALVSLDDSERPEYTKDGKKIKYAGSRFQTAPAPTTLPMPSFF